MCFYRVTAGLEFLSAAAIRHPRMAGYGFGKQNGEFFLFSSQKSRRASLGFRVFA